MHCVHLADLAAVLSQHGPAILYRREAIPEEAVIRYWTSSRARFELWHRTIGRYNRAEQSGDWLQMHRWWRDHLGVLEEILVSDLLTRVIAALAAGLDRDRADEELSPITHAIFLTHLEIRNRVQQLMLFGRGSSVEISARLNRLRKGVERWNDALLGRLWASTPAEMCYAIDASRAKSYAEDARSQLTTDGRETVGWILQAAMHETIARRTDSKASLPQANRQVADSVMLMLRSDLFDSIGTLKSLWLHRVQFDCERTARVVDELMGDRLDSADTASGINSIHQSSFDRW